MRDSETFIYGLLFLAIVGFQVFKQFLAARAEQRRRQEAQARAAASGQQMPQEEPEPLELTDSDWGRPPEPTPPATVRPRELQLVLKPEPAARQRQAPSGGSDRLVAAWQPARARHHLFHSRRALRHGIVMMTVLGPCRAVQPYDNNNSNNNN